MVKLAKVLAVIWTALSLADASVTYLALKDPGLVEGNPIGRFLLYHGGEFAFYGVKVAVSILVGAGFLLLIDKVPGYVKRIVVILLILVVVFTAILVNNFIRL
jgi:hypothetical protein